MEVEITRVDCSSFLFGSEGENGIQLYWFLIIPFLFTLEFHYDKNHENEQFENLAFFSHFFLIKICDAFYI